MFKTTTVLASLCALTTFGATLPLAVAADHHLAAVVGEKRDSGLGDLPHYRHWADRSARLSTSVPGESLDDGLAALPHYVAWTDKSGRHPLGQQSPQVLTASR